MYALPQGTTLGGLTPPLHFKKGKPTTTPASSTWGSRTASSSSSKPSSSPPASSRPVAEPARTQQQAPRASRPGALARLPRTAWRSTWRLVTTHVTGVGRCPHRHVTGTSLIGYSTNICSFMLSAWDDGLDELPTLRRDPRGCPLLVVVAGAGTGKTRALTSRMACLLDRGVPPDRILLLTFTRRAADDMLTRARDLVGSSGETSGPKEEPSTPSPTGTSRRLLRGARPAQELRRA